MVDLVKSLRECPFVLAPMAGITDNAFRSVMRELGNPISITELISANGLKYASDKTRDLMAFTPDQHPVGIQIFGEDLEALAFAAREVEKLGADFVDLNFGCPVKKVVSKGAGSAILKDLGRLREVLQTVKGAVEIPVTIKIRTGWDENSKNAEQVVQIAFEEKITWVSIHGRTRSAGYTGQADWEYIKKVKQESPLPIIGNGDIHTGEQAVQRLISSHCDGVMIGRGALKDPWIFLEAIRHYRNLSSSQPKDHRVVLGRIIEEYLKKFDERLAHLQLKKFAAWYSSGFPEASQFRKFLFSSKSFVETKVGCEEFFSKIIDLKPRDMSHEEFLMGGHG